MIYLYVYILCIDHLGEKLFVKTLYKIDLSKRLNRLRLEILKFVSGKIKDVYLRIYIYRK